MGHRGESQPWRQADRRRSALHALGVGRRLLRADPPGHRHRLPARADQLLHRQRQGAVGLRQGIHQRALRGQGRLRLSRRPVHRLRRGQARLQQGDLGLPARRRRLCRVRPGQPEERLEPVEETRRALHARDGRAHLRHAEGQVPEGGADDRRDVGQEQDHDVDVRARLDPALQGFAEHPRHGDVAADPRQYRRARRRHERSARSLQHPGTDRSRPDVEPDPRLSDHPDGKGDEPRRLYVDARLQAVAAGPDELLAELQEVLRQLPEVDVGRRRHRRQQLRLRLSAEARRAGLRRAARLRADVPGQDERLCLPGLQPAAVVPEPDEAHRRRCRS